MLGSRSPSSTTGLGAPPAQGRRSAWRRSNNRRVVIQRREPMVVMADGLGAGTRKVAAHPWVAGVRVDRQLPSVLSIEIVERQAVAVAVLGGLYLVDPAGRPFKRATMEEADGLPVITGLSRDQYTETRDATEAAF